MTKVCCFLCSNLCRSRTQIVYPSGLSRRGGLCVIGEAPGGDEDRVGEGFVGRAGKTLRNELEQYGITEYAKANIVLCRPGGNRKPSKNEIENCMPLLVKFLKKQKPDVVLLVGMSSAKLFLSWSNKSASLDDLIHRGDTSGIMGFIPNPSMAHPEIREWIHNNQSTPCVPMPHTSPLAWNRNAPDGRKWADIGREQIKMAITHIVHGKK